MSVNSILQSGVQGVQSATQGVERVAKDIVRSGTDSVAGQSNVVESMVDLQLYERSVQASSQIVKTADEVLGTILDMMV
ncbi:MAG: flagellar basal body rod protein FlgG [Oleiphilaceae bacterium]|jgi:flagellar basal body rod protein FlgG